MELLYKIGVRGYAFLVRLASLWNPKAKKWIEGRKEVWEKLQSWENAQNLPVYWFHCASLGEFEQGRPLMEKLKAKEPCKLVVTFFSPSGYEIRKNYEWADLVIYLPKETTSNVRQFLDIIKPEKVFFIKYEFWVTYLNEAKRQGAKLYSVSAVFRKSQPFFKWYGGYMRRALKLFDVIFVQEKASKNLLEGIGINSVLAGDTRYDRVMENARKVQPYPEIESFIGGKKVLVVGSSWAEDDVVLKATLNNPDFDWKVIIAPHEIKTSRIEQLEKTFSQSSLRYSNLNTDNASSANVLIIDNIGMLMNVYQYADIAYVGGAFGKGLHNILEPACFGVPVIFGNKYEKFNEAFDFIDHKIGFAVSDANSFEKRFNSLASHDIKEDVLSFMNQRIGATEKIISEITD